MGHDLAGKADLSPSGVGGTRQSFIQVGSALLTAIRVATIREK